MSESGRRKIGNWAGPSKMKRMTTKMDKREGRAAYVFEGMNVKSFFRRHGVA